MWQFAIKENEIRPDRINRIYPKGRAVLLIKTGTNPAILAIESNCPHMGCSLGGAIFDGTYIQCPCHDWRFDITTGQFSEAREIRLQTFETKIENGEVHINIQEAIA
jgi:3-phenylpropionate/trans-cinnamate dioxygenase ferredoxin subunit